MVHWPHVYQAQVGRTALFYAAQNGRVDCARALVDGGADTEVKERNVRILLLFPKRVCNVSFTKKSALVNCALLNNWLAIVSATLSVILKIV